MGSKLDRETSNSPCVHLGVVGREAPATPLGKVNLTPLLEKEVGKDLGLPTREHYKDIKFNR